MKKANFIGTMLVFLFSFIFYRVVKAAEAARSAPTPSLGVTLEEPPDYLGVVINGGEGNLSLYAGIGNRIEYKGILEEVDPYALAFSPDGKLMLVARGQGSRVGKGLVVYKIKGDAITFKEVLEWEGDSFLVEPTGVVFSPDGKLVVIADESDLLVYSLEQNKLIYKSQLDEGATVTGVAFSPISNVFATISTDKILRVYAVTNGEVSLRTSVPIPVALTSIVFRPITNQIAVLSRESNRLILYGLEGDQLRMLKAKQTGQQPADIAFSPDGRIMAVVNEGDNAVKVYLFTGSGTRSKALPTGQAPSSVAFSPDGKWMAVTSRWEAKLYVYRLGNDIVLAGTLNTGKNPFEIVFSPLLGPAQAQIKETLEELRIVPSTIEQLIAEWTTLKKSRQ